MFFTIGYTFRHKSANSFFISKLLEPYAPKVATALGVYTVYTNSAEKGGFCGFGFLENNQQ